ncbi:hypothetical protein [Limnovirga soli]|jgi:mono/diheme cytochrome c family protein|uniref:Cytochrome c domain-containing protein n=1 Tax=Limnovirga soli TaxID=2656915 RepID=A0A8J8FC28_9BACT|nr:hypothetical protein [Limnovirga soli]NNV55286.1 hypothetical protein [Limnovirga soli]
MKKISVIGLLTFISLIFFNSCYYDKADVVYPAVTCDTTTVRLSVELENIMAASCYSCHSGTADLGGGIVLTDYATIKDYADFGILMSCLIQDGSTSAMPKGGAKLSDCEINKFSAWVNRGAPQN